MQHNYSTRTPESPENVPRNDEPFKLYPPLSHKSDSQDIEELQIQLRETLEQHARNIEEYEKETARLEDRCTAAESQKTTLKNQIDQLMAQDPTANGHTDRIQRALRDETDRHRSEVEALQSQLDRLTADLRDSRTQTSDLESDLAALNEELRTARRVEDSLNQEIQSLREKTISGSRDAELLRKLQAENTEFRAEVSRLQDRLDKVSTTRDRLAGQVNGLESQNPEVLHRHLSEAEKERDIADAQVRNLRSQLEDTKRQVEIQATRLRLTEQNLSDTRDDLAREQARATNLLASPHSAKHVTEVRKLEDLLQQSRLRCAEMGRLNATQLGDIDTLNRKVRRLEGELEVFQRQPRAGDGDRGLHSQLTLAKGQLAEAKAQLAKQEADFARRMETANRVGYTADLRTELARLEKAQRESTIAKEKLEDQVRSLTRQIARLESDGDDRLFSRYQALKAEMDVLREEADAKDVKSAKQLRRVQDELEEVRGHASALERDLGRQRATVRRQVVDTVARGKGRPEDGQVEKRHGAELRGLGKQIRYLKAKLFREQNFRADLQYAKSFFLMQINCFES
jgi:chromosome segregation ATPase